DGVAAPPLVPPSGDLEDVEHYPGGPRADRHVGDRRVDRVAEPGAVERRPEARALRENPRDRPLHAFRQPVEPGLPFDHLDERVAVHLRTSWAARRATPVPGPAPGRPGANAR